MDSKKLSKRYQGNTAQRIVNECYRAFESESIKPSQVRDLLLCDDVDLSRFEIFIYSQNEVLSCFAAKIVALFNPEVVVRRIIDVKSPGVAMLMIEALEDTNYKDVEDLVPELSNPERSIIQDTLIRMFISVGRKELLLPLVFSGDEFLVEKIKRLISEQEE